MKKIISIFMAIICLVSASICTTSCFAEESNGVTTQTTTDDSNVSISLYKDKIITINIDDSLKAKKFYVSQSDKNSTYMFTNLDKESAKKYKLYISTQKVTKKPVTVNVYYKDGKKKVNYKTYKVTVTALKQETFKERKYNVGVKIPTTFYSKDYRNDLDIDMKSNSIIKKKNGKFYGVKEGTATYKVYLTNACVGEVNIVVGDFKTVLRSNYTKKTTNLIYNKHCPYLAELDEYSFININEMIYYPKNNAKYSLKSNGKNILRVDNTEKRIYTNGSGKATYTLYQTVDGNKVEVGEFTVNIKKVNDAYVMREREGGMPDGFYEEGIYLKLSKKYSGFKSDLDYNFLSKKTSGCDFKKSDYKITYTVKNKKIATVDKNGVIKAKKVGKTKLTVKVSFSDKSSYTFKIDIFVGKH